MVAAIIILSVLLILVSWLAYIQIRKVSKLTAYMELFTRVTAVTAVKVSSAYKRMKQIDRLGSFEADDETGFIFQEIKEATTELNDFVKRYIDDGSEQEKK
jgi:hypothetical protein